MSEAASWLLPPDKLPAHAIPADLYDLTLVWPLLLEDLDEPRQKQSAAARLESWTEEICNRSDGAWQPVRRDYPNREDKQVETEYSEFVFFHPFVRNFLYASRDDIWAHHRDHPVATDAAPNRNMRLLERDDLKSDPAQERKGAGLEVAFDLRNPDTGVAEEVLVCLRVRDVQLYLFDTRVALLALKLKRDGAAEQAGEHLLRGQFTLQTVLQLQDQVRRAYAPYWESTKQRDGSLTHAAGHCPRRMRLITEHDTWESHFGSYVEPPPAQHAERKAVEELLEHVNKYREPPAVALWLKLLEPLLPVEGKGYEKFEKGKCNLRFQQIEDERLALFSYLAVPEPRRITTGDWLRLATVDDPGDSTRFPFSPEFLDEDGLKQFCYDRYWSPSDAAPAQDWFTTRWLCCGYGFTGVGCSGGRIAEDDRLDAFFANPHSGARAHFRHHYFKLGLIAHFHRASLLAFKHDLAQAVDELRQTPDSREADRQFQDRITRIEKEVLTFRNMYWFTEVSNQIQPQELFQLWSRHLNTEELFQQVFGEAREASQVIVGWNEREQAEESEKLARQSARLAKESKRLTEQQTQLTLVATLLVLLQPLPLILNPDKIPWWACALLSWLLAGVGILIILGNWKTLSKRLERLSRSCWKCAAGLTLTALISAVAWRVVAEQNAAAARTSGGAGTKRDAMTAPAPVSPAANVPAAEPPPPVNEPTAGDKPVPGAVVPLPTPAPPGLTPSASSPDGPAGGASPPAKSATPADAPASGAATVIPLPAPAPPPQKPASEPTPPAKEPSP